MKYEKDQFKPPYGERSFEFMRSTSEGAYWQGADGFIVRVAAPEPGREAIQEQRELLSIACRDALAQ